MALTTVNASRCLSVKPSLWLAEEDAVPELLLQGSFNLLPLLGSSGFVQHQLGILGDPSSLSRLL